MFPYDFRDERMMKKLKEITQRILAIYPELRPDVTNITHSLVKKVCISSAFIYRWGLVILWNFAKITFLSHLLPCNYNSIKYGVGPFLIKFNISFQVHWFGHLKIKADIIWVSFTSGVMKTDHLISFGIYWFLSLLQLNELQNYEEELARWNSEATLRSNTQEVPTVSFITESLSVSHEK